MDNKNFSAVVVKSENCALKVGTLVDCQLDTDDVYPVLKMDIIQDGEVATKYIPIRDDNIQPDYSGFMWHFHSGTIRFTLVSENLEMDQVLQSVFCYNWFGWECLKPVRK